MTKYHHHQRGEPLQTSFFSKAMIAGGVCAVVSAILNPLDVTKIRIQLQINHPGQEKKYKGLLSGIQRIIREEGVRGILRGVFPSMMREITYSSFRIGAYEPLRLLLSRGKDDPADSSPAIKLFASLLTGAVGSAIANPFDLIKTRFQSILPGEELPYRGTWTSIAGIYRSEGFAGLYKGWMATSARAAVLTSFQIGAYDSIKHNLLINTFDMDEGIPLHLAASMTAGIITTTATNPFDVIKTRYLSDLEGKYKSLFDCTIQTYRTCGVGGFFKGWVPFYWRVGPYTVMSLLLIEQVRRLFGLGGI